MKVEEGKEPKKDDFFSRIPPALPIFEKAAEIQQTMRRVGFDWPDSAGVFDKVQEEIQEVRESLEEGGDTEEELGDLLFSVINLTRFLGYNPSYALRRANEKVQARFNRVVAQAREEGLVLKTANLDQMEALWQRAKDEA